MPLYEYRCTECGHNFEKIQHFNSPELTECPKCKGKLERPLSAPAFQFKGAGWYVTDYAGKGGASMPPPAKPAESKAPAGESSNSPQAAAAPAPAATTKSE